MRDELMTSSRSAFARARLGVLGLATAACWGVMAVYLALVLPLAVGEGLALAGCLAGTLPVAVALAALRTLGARRSIVRALASAPPVDASALGGGSATAETRTARRALDALPASLQVDHAIGVMLAAVLCPLPLWAMGHGVFLEPTSLRSLLLVALVAGTVSSFWVYYASRRALAPLRRHLGLRLQERLPAVDPIAPGSPWRRMQLATVWPVLGAALLFVDASLAGERAEAEREAAAWARAALEKVAADEAGTALSESVAADEAGTALSESVARRLPAPDFWPLPTRFFELDPERIATADVAPPPFLGALDEALGSDRSSGSFRVGAAGEWGAYRSRDDGMLWVARVGTATASPGLVAGIERPLVLGLLLVALAAALAMAVSRELARALQALASEADALASGDLRVRPVVDAVGELGALSSSLEAIGGGMRRTVQRASSAAEQLEQALAPLAGAVDGVLETSGDQAARIREAEALMTRIDGGMSTAVQSARALSTSIEESSESVVELGAAGEQLNETAGVLSSRVDTVSDSLEQMVRSVGEVRATTERLASASEETSSSMEEMASAMRAVDDSAETTARLSRDVVSKAELGQAKVVQTIEGMEAIREATDAAERVIRGLGARTLEIGGILDVIDDVADETNLLALNAAIIAAQAGEQGKAFSVVADEIKELADRVLASTKEIGALIRSVQEESENAIGAIEAGSASVMSGVDLSAEAGRTLEEITDASRESGTRIGEIVASVREQTRAASHVVQLMERVRESADAIGEAGGEQDRGHEVVHHSAQTMREVALQVRRTTEEQARGIGRIRDGVVGVRGGVEEITSSLAEQSEACGAVATALERVARKSQSNEAAAVEMRRTMQGLAAQAESLRADVARFRVE